MTFRVFNIHILKDNKDMFKARFKQKVSKLNLYLGTTQDCERAEHFLFLSLFSYIIFVS